MSVKYQHEVLINAPAYDVWAVIDDLPLTAKWLPPCVSLSKVGTGPNATGDKLRYVYKQGGKQAEMEGKILSHIPGQRLHALYFDKMFEVSVDLLVASSGNATRSTHIIEITPKTFLGRLMSPLIRTGVKKQTQQAARNLKELVEADA